MSDPTKTICGVCGGECGPNGCDKPVKKGYYAEGPVVDPAPYLLKITQIAEAKNSRRLTKFEAKILKEVAHAATRFRDTFRISPKQAKIIEGIWADHYLPSLLDSKTEED